MFSCCSRRSEKEFTKTKHTKQNKTKQNKTNVYLKTKISYDNHLE